MLETFKNVPFYKDDKTAVFIDGSNLYLSAKYLEFDIDYRLLLEFFLHKGRLLRTYYYTTLVEDQEYSPIKPLIDWLDYNGYRMLTKKSYDGGEQNRKKQKTAMDIEMAVDILEMAERADHILLFTGEGGFRRVVEAVQAKGVRVTVVSTVKSSPAMISDELRRQADYFLDLDDLAEFIMRDGGGNVTDYPEENREYA